MKVVNYTQTRESTFSAKDTRRYSVTALQRDSYKMGYLSAETEKNMKNRFYYIINFLIRVSGIAVILTVTL